MSQGQLQLLKQIIRAGESTLSLPIDQLRHNFEAFVTKFPGLDGVRLTPVPEDGPRGEWVDAVEGPRRGTMLYLHGGGFVVGSARSHRQLVARLSQAAGVRSLVLDYRRAPEYPFPAALEDAMAAYRWLLEQEVEPERLVVAGDSAGGGLGVVALAQLRAEGLPMPAALVCLSPWVDFEGASESLIRNADQDPVVQRDGLIKMAHLYLSGTDPWDPRVTPLAADLEGLPPMLIQVGGVETLYDDAVRLAARAQKAEVEVIFDEWAGMIHVWQLFAGRLVEGQEAITKAGLFIGNKLRGRAPKSIK